MAKSNSYPCQLPPALKPGDRVTVIAPSGALKEFEALEKGLAIWRSRGYQVELGSNWNYRHGYLAGDDHQRREALAQAWSDRNCQAILCVRGGYGGARLLEDWDWNTNLPKQTNPKSALCNSKWLVGFSDVTSLLWSLATIGIGGVHAPVLTTLANEPEWSINRLFDCLEGRKLEPLQGKGWGGNQTTGILLPANLTVATHLLKTPIQPSFEGIILALEDVTEAPYRIDRMLTQWRLMGAFTGIKGIALGRFSRCDAPVGFNSWTVEEVIRDRLSDLNIPIVSDLPFGHDGINAALPVGQLVHLDGEKGVLSWC
jgi:muramoyltetrapeptide carboxypeptidase